LPFKSRAKERYMFAVKPGLAKEFAAATPKGMKLPDHVPGSKSKPKSGLGKWI